ncbi:MAG: hypothetical protein KDC74_13385 [Flavobacteriaceae bacterium]|nr:hypothetical protein [Flavobacteriaceae bacterium]
MKLLLIIPIFFFFACNNVQNNNKYLAPQKSVIINENVLIKNSEAKELYEKGIELFEKSDYSNAFESFNKANQIEPNNVIILNALANLHNQFGNKSDAENLYKKAITLDSSYVISYVNYGKLLIQNKSFNEANEILIKGLNEKPSNSEKASLYFNLMVTMVNTGECEKAKEYGRLAENNAEITEQKEDILYWIAKIDSYCKK